MNEIEVIRPDPEAVRKEAEKERLLSEKRREHRVGQWMLWLEKGRDGESFPLEACQKDFDSF